MPLEMRVFSIEFILENAYYFTNVHFTVACHTEWRIPSRCVCSPINAVKVRRHKTLHNQILEKETIRNVAVTIELNEMNKYLMLPESIERTSMYKWHWNLHFPLFCEWKNSCLLKFILFVCTFRNFWLFKILNFFSLRVIEHFELRQNQAFLRIEMVMQVCNWFHVYWFNERLKIVCKNLFGAVSVSLRKVLLMFFYLSSRTFLEWVW